MESEEKMKKIIKTLIELLEDQEGVKIEYSIEKRGAEENTA